MIEIRENIASTTLSLSQLKLAISAVVGENCPTLSVYNVPKQAKVTSCNLDFYEYETFENVQTRLPYFVEEVYNQKRLHSALG